jgi:hypothetical protein
MNQLLEGSSKERAQVRLQLLREWNLQRGSRSVDTCFIEIKLLFF